MTEQSIKLFGERNTATRAVLRMIDATPGICSAAATPDHEAEDAALKQEVAQIAGKMVRPWRRIYREAVKDRFFAQVPPVRAWKHTAPTYDSVYAAERIAVLFTVRNPYSWVLALHRNPYHMMGELPAKLGDFIDLPWLTVARDGLEPLLASPVELWNRKLAAYLAFMEQAKADGVAHAVLKFEDFVAKPPESFTEAAAKMGIVCPNPVYDPKPTKRLGLTLRSRKTYYGRGDWAKNVSQTDIDAITDRIDWDVAAGFGYSKGALTN